MAVVIGLALIVSLAFVFAVVHRPVKELMAGTQRVADGDLDYRLEVHSADELGELAHEFNLMTEQLADARAKILARAETLEEHVERKTKELERTQTVLIGSEKYASLGKLAATVAHEVNNPLFGILTYARLSRKELEKANLGDEKTRQLDEQLQVIERESRRCGEIMRNLLTFARQAPPRRENARLEELVQRAVKLVRHQLELQAIALEEHYETDLPAVSCDANQIQQAVLVLLVNAYEAMPNGGNLQVGTCMQDSKVSICVKDTGGGIPASALENIFEPFFTTKDNQHRTGLGLSVAKGIVEKHEGTIEVASEAGRGTEFRIVLPVGAAETALAEGKVR
jgi:two-component system NtrC family sensor kinase